MSDAVTRRKDYANTLAALEGARIDLVRALDEFGAATRAVAAALEEGRDVAGALQDLHWVGIRQDMERGWASFQHGLYEARCAAVLIMVEDEGLSLSAIARMRGISRQLVSRLYNDARDRPTSAT